MNLHRIAIRIISTFELDGILGWLYVDTDKFVPLSDRNCNIHYKFVYRHLAEDIGFNKALDEFPDLKFNQKIIDTFREFPENFFGRIISGYQNRNQAICEKIQDHLVEIGAISRERLDGYMRHPEENYSKDYNAIRISMGSYYATVTYTGWNQKALFALQKYLKNTNVSKVELGDYLHNTYGDYDYDEFKKLRSVKLSSLRKLSPLKCILMRVRHSDFPSR